MIDIQNWPTCGVCNKGVDKVEAWDDFHRRARVFRVFCHGEVEEAELGDSTIINSTSISFDRAFDKPRIEHERQRVEEPGGQPRLRDV